MTAFEPNGGGGNARLREERRLARDTATPQELARELSEAVTEWWLALRPVDWSEAAHLDNPTVNCANERERAVALALVALLRSERDDF